MKRLVEEERARRPTPASPFSISGKQELLLVGWSAQQQRMVLTVFVSDDPLEGFQRIDVGIDRIVLAPHGAPVSAVGLPENDQWTLDAMLRVVRAQVAWGLAETGVKMFGGRLLLAELARDTFSSRLVPL